MTHETLLNELWMQTLARLGGASAIAGHARETKAFLRPRGIKSAEDLLRFVLAYACGAMGLRSTCAQGPWGRVCRAGRYFCRRAARSLAQLRAMSKKEGMEKLVAILLADTLGSNEHKALARGRIVRLVDATTVQKAGIEARSSGQLWRIHAAFDLPLQSWVAVQPF